VHPDAQNTERSEGQIQNINPAVVLGQKVQRIAEIKLETLDPAEIGENDSELAHI